MSKDDANDSLVFAVFALCVLLIAGVSIIARDRCWIQFTPEFPHFRRSIGSPTPIEDEDL